MIERAHVNVIQSGYGVDCLPYVTAADADLGWWRDRAGARCREAVRLARLRVRPRTPPDGPWLVEVQRPDLRPSLLRELLDGAVLLTNRAERAVIAEHRLLADALAGSARVRAPGARSWVVPLAEVLERERLAMTRPVSRWLP